MMPQSSAVGLCVYTEQVQAGGVSPGAHIEVHQLVRSGSLGWSTSRRQVIAPDADGPCLSPSLARSVCAFVSGATNLTPHDLKGYQHVFVCALDSQRIEWVSQGPGGTAADGDSLEPSISADGRWVAFTSYADNLVSGDGNRTSDVFLWDAQTHAVELLSRTSRGTSGNGPSYRPSISADGSRVAFVTRATDLEASPVARGQVYLWDRSQGLRRLMAGSSS